MAPPCYKVQFRERVVWIPEHSIEFWNYDEGQREDKGAEPTKADEPGGAGQRSEIAKSGEEASGVRDTNASNGAPSPSLPLELECLACMEREPTLVFHECGHLGVCSPCGRRMLATQYNHAKSEKNQVPFGKLN